MGTLYTRLSSITGEMSPESIEHHIARVMLEHIHQLNNISIGAMADLCSVSKSTISKFVKQLGFEDYKEFKAEAYSRGKREVYIALASAVRTPGMPPGETSIAACSMS